LELNLLEFFDLMIETCRIQNTYLADTDGEERWENVLELRTVAEQYEDLPPASGLAAFLEGVALVADVDSLDESKEATVMITLHQAKGLEFRLFLLSYGKKVSSRISNHFDDPAQMEEERRLCYVRHHPCKKKSLPGTSVPVVNLMGGHLVNDASRFLTDIQGLLS